MRKMIGMPWKVSWSRSALKGLRRLDKKQQEIVVRWVAANLEGCDNPRAISGGKSMQGTTNGWRWRVGHMRIIAWLYDDELVIDLCRVGQREGVYKHLS